MPLYRPSELRQFLLELKTGPKKGLSQNFLIDGNILNKILAEADVQEGDAVLEIGGGPGVLTEALFAKKCDLTVVEKDPVFAKALHRFSGINVFEGDILEFPLETLETLKKGKKIKVVANLPYHLTSPILGLLLPRSDLFSSVTVMVQEEVALRMVAKPGSKEYSSLTLFVNFYSDARYAFFVRRKSFYPAPKVDSAVVTFDLKKPPLEKPEPFFDFVHKLFCQRRKMVRTTLSDYYEKTLIEESLEKLKTLPTVRPEELSLETTLSLFKLLNGQT